MKTTKEQLAIELAKIRASHADWVSGDERKRKEFAKAFNWYDAKQYSYSERSVRLPSWEEIFVELGKVLAARDLLNIEYRISGLEIQLKELDKPEDHLKQF